MPRRHSESTRLAAVFLAEQNGPDAAAEALGLDPRTVRSWQETLALPADRWTAIRDLLQARAGELAAKGETKGLVAMLTGAGIADRNVRYATLIERREKRRADEAKADAPSAVRLQLDRLDMTRKRLLRQEIAVIAARRQVLQEPEPIEDPVSQDVTALTALVDELLARSDDEIAARLAALSDEHKQLEAIHRQHLEELDRERRLEQPRDRFAEAQNVTPRPKFLETSEAVNGTPELDALILEAEAMLLDVPA